MRKRYAANLESESKESTVASIDANADSLETSLIPNLELTNSAAPETGKKGTEFSSLPAQSQLSAPKPGLKEAYSKMMSDQELIPAPVTKRQRMNSSNLFKRSSFKKKKR